MKRGKVRVLPSAQLQSLSLAKVTIFWGTYKASIGSNPAHHHPYTPPPHHSSPSIHTSFAVGWRWVNEKERKKEERGKISPYLETPDARCVKKKKKSLRRRRRKGAQ
jgi:hypothetical protein